MSACMLAWVPSLTALYVFCSVPFSGAQHIHSHVHTAPSKAHLRAHSTRACKAPHSFHAPQQPMSNWQQHKYHLLDVFQCLHRWPSLLPVLMY